MLLSVAPKYSFYMILHNKELIKSLMVVKFYNTEHFAINYFVFFQDVKYMYFDTL